LTLAIVAGTAGCAGGANSVATSSATSTAAATTTAAPSTAPGSDGVAPLPASPPVRLRIPAIGVDSGLMDLGLDRSGSLEVPPDGFPAGWYTGAPTPGSLGPAIIAGHVDWAGSPGVFYSLRDLVAGDDITVDRADGTAARFRVESVQQFPKDAFPTDQVYADIDHAGLRLITCGGSFDRAARSYRDNIVVFAALTGVGPA
jgi:hypothetical protein